MKEAATESGLCTARKRQALCIGRCRGRGGGAGGGGLCSGSRGGRSHGLSGGLEVDGTAAHDVHSAGPKAREQPARALAGDVCPEVHVVHPRRTEHLQRVRQQTAHQPAQSPCGGVPKGHLGRHNVVAELERHLRDGEKKERHFKET